MRTNNDRGAIFGSRYSLLTYQLTTVQIRGTSWKKVGYTPTANRREILGRPRHYAAGMATQRRKLEVEDCCEEVILLPPY